MNLETYLHGTCGLFSNTSRNVKLVLTREEVENLFLSSIGDMKLLIKIFNKHSALVERMASINSNLELLYEQTVLCERREENAN